MKPKSQGKFCDYCTCEDCQNGTQTSYKFGSKVTSANKWSADLEKDVIATSVKETKLKNYECADDTHICEVCLFVEPCEDENGKIAQEAKDISDHYCISFPICKHKPLLKDIGECFKCKSKAHIKCEDGNYICRKCWAEPCVIGGHGAAYCDKFPECEHKPKIITI